MPPNGRYDYHVAFTSPYIIELPGETEWRSFFRRALLQTKIDDEKTAYAALMKSGLSPDYWSDYIFEGYRRHTDCMISLLGVPDVEAGRPHSKATAGNEARLRHHYGAALRG